MDELLCQQQVVSDPQDLAISVVNTGTEAKVFRVLTGGTGVDEVVDNTLLVEAPNLIAQYPSVDVTSQAIPLLVAEKGLIFSLLESSPSPNGSIAIFNIGTTLTTSIDLGMPITPSVSIQLYYLNGFVYIFGFLSGRNCIILNASNFTFSIISIPGIGPLRYGCVDTIRNRVYLCGVADNIIRSIDSPSNALGPTINLSVYGGGGLLNCCLGDTYLACLVGTAIVILSPTLIGFTFVASYGGILSGAIDIGFTGGSFGFAEPGKINFIRESDLVHTSSLMDVRAAFFSSEDKQNRYLFISNQLKSGYTSVDFVDYTASLLISGTDSADQYPIPVYNSFVDRVIVTDSSVTHAPDYWAISINPINLSSEIYVSSTLIVNGVLSNSDSILYYPALGGDMLFTVLGISSRIGVTITYNGGITSSEYMQKSTLSKPMKVLKMRIEASSFAQLSNLLQKIKMSSAGEVFNFNIQNLVHFDAASVQYIVDFDGSDLTDPIFDAIRYMQGTINGNSSLNFHITYQEYSPEDIVNSSCQNLRWKDEVTPKKKVKHCIFNGRGFKQFI